jgi:hypothetical protein
MEPKLRVGEFDAVLIPASFNDFKVIIFNIPRDVN